MATISAQDLESEQLIAKILENDLLLLESFNHAEKDQLDQILAISARAQGRVPKYSKTVLDSGNILDADSDIAFKLYVTDARLTTDAACAQAMQNQANVQDTLDRQYALKLAAAERYVVPINWTDYNIWFNLIAGVMFSGNLI